MPAMPNFVWPLRVYREDTDAGGDGVLRQLPEIL